MECDGFVLVKGKHRRRPAKASNHGFNKDSGVSCESEHVDKLNLVKKIDLCRKEIEESEYFHSLQGQFKVLFSSQKYQASEGMDGDCETSDCQNQPDIEELVCYGVGHFATCLIARYQLGLLVLFRDHFKISRGRSHVFDPVFNSTEIEILEELGFSVPEDNEEGKRRSGNRTLFFLPHCGKPLYNNLLWANWSPDLLTNLVLIGNSFHNMQESIPERVLQSQAGYISKVLPYTEELPIENIFRYPDIFNDISIHVFPFTALQTAPSSLWENREEPVYDKHYVEIILSANKLD